MGQADFVHLHVHSQYSMLDGAIRIEPLVKWAKSNAMRAIALTDHGNMFGVMQFNKAARQHGILPIIGCELNIRDTSSGPGQHILLLSAGEQGYHNLIRLVSHAWLKGAGRDAQPVIELGTLRECHKGLVGLSACLGGYLAQQILHKGATQGREALGNLKDCFEPGSFFVELQDHGFPEQKPLNRILVDIAREFDVPLVATNDCHYPEKKDAHAQLILQCIATGRQVAETERSHHRSHELFLKTAEEMKQRFVHLPDAIKNTLRIAEMCAGTVNPIRAPLMPTFPVPENMDEQAYFRKLAEDGLARRFREFAEVHKAVDQDMYRKRLFAEWEVICAMGFASYFLVVQDFVNRAIQKGIPVGPGRGSGAGSLVAYALRITDLDPIQYGLLFERFLNPERVSMPDFDIDFCMDRRDEIISYVRDKYGDNSVGQIATFHALKSRSVVRDVARVMGMTPQEAGRIATLIPEPIMGKSVPISEALKKEPRLKRLYEDEPRVRELVDNAQTLEDLTRHAGMHAAGIVISKGALWEHVPVFCPEPGIVVTQYDKDDVEAAGLVKFDFLGLRTLTVIDIATRLIDRRPDRSEDAFRIDRIPLDDAATFALLSSGETTNVFQLESSGMQSLFKQLKPDALEDVIAAVALYRPGPLGSGMVEDFVQRKHGRVPIRYPHPNLEPILKETYGVLVYQEQVMQVAREMAGYSLGSADVLRRAMGKKKPEEMAKQKAAFITGSIGKGYQPQDAERVFELMSFFAGYGFNKSHSAAYALLTYQTAFLKANFPVEFLCATLTADKDKSDKVVRTISEARSMGVVVLPPDVNESAIDFTVVYDDAPDPNIARKPDKPVSRRGKLYDLYRPRLRFGLGAVKGVGTAALESILAARSADGASTSESRTRPFQDLFDFAARVDLRKVNKTAVEALVQCGAFGTSHGPRGISRTQAFAAIDAALERGRKQHSERCSGQTNLLGLFGEAPSAQKSLQAFPTIVDWDDTERLAREKRILGFYVSGHPLDRYVRELDRFCTASTITLASSEDGREVTLAGTVEGYRERSARTGGKIAFFQLEDPHGRIEVVVRTRVLDQAREALTRAEPVLAVGTVQFEQDQSRAGLAGSAEATSAVPVAKLVLKEAHLLSDALRQRARSLCIRFEVDTVDKPTLNKLRAALEQHPGNCPVELQLRSSEKWWVRMPQVGFKVAPSDALKSHIEALRGVSACELY